MGDKKTLGPHTEEKLVHVMCKMMNEIQDLDGVKEKMSSLRGPTFKKIKDFATKARLKIEKTL